jgi:hypothetical protein
MSDIRGIERRLNEDPHYRAAFLNDPVGTLLAAGLTLSTENANLLRQRVAAIQRTAAGAPGSAIRSSALGPGGSHPVATTITAPFAGSTSAAQTFAHPFAGSSSLATTITHPFAGSSSPGPEKLQPIRLIILDEL